MPHEVEAEEKSSGSASQLGSHPPSRRRVRAQYKDLALAWVAATVLGGFAISLLPDSLGLSRDLVPLLIIAGYLGFAVPRGQQGIQKIADSAYFMGFLWTLWALIFVLITRADHLTATALYRAFGHALVATGSGMFARLLLLQFYRSVSDQEDEAIDEVDDHLDVVRKRFYQHSQAISQELSSIESTVISTGARLESTSQDLVDSLEKSSNSISAKAELLEKAVGTVRTKLESLDVPSTLIADRIGKAMEAVQAEVVRSVQGAAKGIDGLTSEMARVRTSITTWATNTEQLDSATKATSEGMRAIAAAATTTANSLGVISAGLKKCSDDLSAFQVLLTKSSESVGSQTSHTSHELQVLSTGIQRAQSEIRKVDSGLREVVGFVQGQFRNR